MPIVVACPKCKKKYKLPDNMLGKGVKCTQCETQFKAPVPKSKTKTPQGDPRKRAAAQQAQAQQAKALKAMGVEGTIERQADIFSGTGGMPGTADPLGNHIIDDPGFGGGDADLQLAPQPTDKPDDPMATMFSNPALEKNSGKPKSKGGTGKRGKRKKRARHEGVQDSINRATMTLLIIGVLIAMFFGFLFISAKDDTESMLNNVNNIAVNADEQLTDEEIEAIAKGIAAVKRIAYGIGILIGVGFMIFRRRCSIVPCDMQLARIDHLSGIRDHFHARNDRFLFDYRLDSQNCCLCSFRQSVHGCA